MNVAYAREFVCNFDSRTELYRYDTSEKPHLPTRSLFLAFPHFSLMGWYVSNKSGFSLSFYQLHKSSQLFFVGKYI